MSTIKIKNLLTIFLIMTSAMLSGQGAFDVSIGMTKPRVNPVVFYNPSRIGKQMAFTEQSGSTINVFGSLNYRHLYKFVRIDLGTQLCGESYFFVPMLASTDVLDKTKITMFTTSLYGTVNFVWRKIGIGFGPTLKYIIGQKITSGVPLVYNIIAVRPVSLGLKFNLDYSFKIKTHQFITGYNYDWFETRRQIKSELLYNSDARDVFIHDFPLKSHSIRLAYVFH